jgi:hypothetical protein
MTVSTRAQARRHRQQRMAALGREVAAAEAGERLEREAEAARQRAARDERDREARQRVHEVRQQLTTARRAAEDAQTDLEMACARLASGHATIEQVESVQLVRDEARRTLECWSLASAGLSSDPVVRGRR